MIGRIREMRDAELNADELARETDIIIDLWHRYGEDTSEEGDKPWLFILRNQMPDSLLGPNCLFQRYSTPHYSEEMVGKYFDRIQKKHQLLRRCQDRLTLVLPKSLGSWFIRPSPMISARGDIPETIDSVKCDIAETVWAAFKKEWVTEKRITHFWSPSAKEKPIINILPDIWVYCSSTVTKLFKLKRPNPDSRIAIVGGFSRWAHDLCEERGMKGGENTKLLENWISQGDLRVIKASAVGFNPKFGGWRVHSLKRVSKLMEHAWHILQRCSVDSNGSSSSVKKKRGRRL